MSEFSNGDRVPGSKADFVVDLQTFLESHGFRV